MFKKVSDFNLYNVTNLGLCKRIGKLRNDRRVDRYSFFRRVILSSNACTLIEVPGRTGVLSPLTDLGWQLGHSQADKLSAEIETSVAFIMHHSWYCILQCEQFTILASLSTSYIFYSRQAAVTFIHGEFFEYSGLVYK